MDGTEKSLETRQRLLEAAGEVFASRGFRDATTREICEKAQANVAAGNYHFGDKEELYAAVFDYARTCAVAQFSELGSPTTPPDERLHAFVPARLNPFLDQGQPARP